MIFLSLKTVCFLHDMQVKKLPVLIHNINNLWFYTNANLCIFGKEALLRQTEVYIGSILTEELKWNSDLIFDLNRGPPASMTGSIHPAKQWGNK